METASGTFTGDAWSLADQARFQRAMERQYGAGIDAVGDRMYINIVIDWALLKLTQEACSSLFGAQTTILGKLFNDSAGSILSELRSRESFHAVQTLPYDAITDADPTFTRLGLQNGFTASIAVNRDGFKDFTGLTHTILHELGQVLRADGFVGGQFEDDDFAFGSDGQTTNQTNKNNIMWDKCFGGKP